jgi:GGDEF domain-containing protein
VLGLSLNTSKILAYNKTALLPALLVCAFILYFFSISEFSDETYHTIHFAFLITAGLALAFGVILRVPFVAISISVIYISYLIINSQRYSYGEDYIFSAGYNIWSILLLPNLLISNYFFAEEKKHRHWSWFYIFILAQTAILERFQTQSIDADSPFFYKHIGDLNYPAFYIGLLCLTILFAKQILNGKILNAATFFVSVAVFLSLFYSDNLFAYSLFFLAAAVVELLTVLYYSYYVQYKDEEIDIPNLTAFYKEADNPRKYPLKYSIALMYIDEYDRLLKRFGESKALILKKMFLARIKKVKPNVLIYNYKPDALILAFKNYNISECFDFAEDIRRLIAKSVFVFNENNHLQLTVSQCVSEKKRSDAGAAMVLERAEENLKKACKFTHNITVRA